MAREGARAGVVTGGTWCCDHNKIVEYWPAEDGLVEILSEAREGGGSACNMAVDLKRLDPDLFVETIGVVGDDEDGRLLLAQADAHGIRRDQMRVDPSVPTNYTEAFASKRTGRRTHLFKPGTSAVLSPDDFDFSSTGARLLHLGLPGVHRIMDAPWGDDANGWVTVLKKARAAGLETNLELAQVGAEKIARIVRPCLPHLDLLIVNDVEIGDIAGMRTVLAGKTDVDACVAAAKRVLEMGAMLTVGVHFPTGAIAIERDGKVWKKPSVKVPDDQIVGANGAGDAFAAGILYGLVKRWSIERTIELGHAAAAASLRSVGTTSGVESWQGCLELAERWGRRDSLD